MSGADSLEVQGRRLLEEGRWEDARAVFQRSLAESPSPSALIGMSDVCFWQDEVRLSIEFRERAFTALRQHGDSYAAAECAVALSVVYASMLGNLPAARGWLARAESTLEGLETGPFAGWFALLTAIFDDDLTDGREHILEALAIARETGDADLELCALSELGVVLVQLGETSEGLRRIDEAMAGALAREGTLLDTVVYTSCSMMHACMLAADLGRVIQWCRAADGFTQRFGNLFLYAFCRVAYGRVLLMRGHWREAEEEIQSALQATRENYPAMYREAVAIQAELVIRRGQHDVARRILTDAAEPLELALPAASLALRTGEPETAIALIHRWRESNVDRLSGPLHSGRGDRTIQGLAALELLVRAQLAIGNFDDANDACRRLVDIAAKGSALARAHAALAGARITNAEGDAAGALSCYEEALATFAQLEMPFEMAVVHGELAHLYQNDKPALARAEAMAALTIFQRLGAQHEVATLAALTGTPISTARRGSRANQLLTRREEEILGLLAEGLSNVEIAERLVISRKTASHHVSNLLAKLGLRNRTEAAAFAVRRSTGASPPPMLASQTGST